MFKDSITIFYGILIIPLPASLRQHLVLYTEQHHCNSSCKINVYEKIEGKSMYY